MTTGTITTLTDANEAATKRPRSGSRGRLRPCSETSIRQKSVTNQRSTPPKMTGQYGRLQQGMLRQRVEMDEAVSYVGLEVSYVGLDLSRLPSVD